MRLSNSTIATIASAIIWMMTPLIACSQIPSNETREQEPSSSYSGHEKSAGTDGYVPTVLPSFASLPSYDCVDSSSCHLIFPSLIDGKGVITEQNPTSLIFESLYGHLNWLLWLGKSNINVLHIGGSHVQAGFLSHRIRTHLTSMAPQCQGSRGLLFPYRAIPSNAPLDYRIEVEGQWRSTRNVFQAPTASLGLSGAAVFTDDSLAALNIIMKEGPKYRFDSLLVIGDANHPDVSPVVTITSDTTARITFAGMRKGYKKQTASSSKKKKKTTTPTPPLDTCHYTLRGILPFATRFSSIAEGQSVSEPLSSYGITYTESGINGAAVPSWLRCSLFEEELSLLPPDLVIFGIGINDANVPPTDFSADTFKAQYRELIARIRRVNPKAAFIFITNNDCWFSINKKYRRKPNTNTPLVRQAMLDLAAEYQGAVFDVYSIMGGQRSSDQWLKAGLMQKDHIHFTSSGYYLIGDMLYNAFLSDYLRFNQ